MNKHSFVLIITLILSAAQAWANIQSKDALLFQNIPGIGTASRQILTVLESPATATIITRQDIVHSG